MLSLKGKMPLIACVATAALVMVASFWGIRERAAAPQPVPEQENWRAAVEAPEHESGHGYEGETATFEATQQFNLTRLSAEKGNASAQFGLGEYYQEGFGVKQSYREAFLWFKKAAEQDDVRAMSYLGRYYRGEFPAAQIARDDEAAEYWLQKAARSGDPEAIKQLGTFLVLKVEEDGDMSRKEEATWWYNRATGGPVDPDYTPPPLPETPPAPEEDEFNHIH